MSLISDKKTKTQIMAILNVTPDSYFADSRVNTVSEAINRAKLLEHNGADILDIGGESTRPGSLPVDEEEELRRVIPVIQGLKEMISIPISVDTVKPAVAKKAIEAGASLINDVSGFSNPEMRELAASSGLDICVMHMHGTPETMQIMPPDYNGNIIDYLLKWFEKKIMELIKEGVRPEKIILDPGIGFGKTVADNVEIIHNLQLIKKLGFRVLLGASRKSFLKKILNLPTEELLPSTLAVSTLAINKSVDIIRVHDVKEHRSVVDFMSAYNEYNE